MTVGSDSPIKSDPDILGGAPVFRGTRVPVRILIEHLEAGDRLDEFLEDYPSVSRDQAAPCSIERKRCSPGKCDRPAPYFSFIPLRASLPQISRRRLSRPQPKR